MTDTPNQKFKIFGKDVSLEKGEHVDLETLKEGDARQIAQKMVHVGLCNQCRKALMDRYNKAQQN